MDFTPSVRRVQITHLCFADDLMVFLDGSRRSIEETLLLFDEYAAVSGLVISQHKSTIFLAGVKQETKTTFATLFPFAQGELSVRYLGLPLLSKRMCNADYETLIDRIRMRMSSWTTRHLSYAGRQQLLKAVIIGIVIFWIQAFRLPSQCIKRIEGLCVAFLWSGPTLNTKKAKVAWVDICKPKEEGGLGFKSLKEANVVCCLKLLWSIVGKKKSLWVRWVDQVLI